MADPKHGTTVANQPLQLALEKHYRRFAVLSVDGADLVYYTLDGSEPALGANGTYVLPAAVQEVPHTNPDLSLVPTVIFKSAGVVKVSVRPL